MSHLERLTDEEVEIIADHRRRQELTKLRLERQAEERNRLHDLLHGTDWKTRDGEMIPVASMTPNHARNAIPYAIARYQRYLLLITSPFDEADWGAAHEVPPLIAALKERANEPETWRDRRADRKNRKLWEKRRATP